MKKEYNAIRIWEHDIIANEANSAKLVIQLVNQIKQSEVMI